MRLEVPDVARKDRFHPGSPVQRDRTSPVPFVIAALLLAAVAWQARESLVDALAPPYLEQPDNPSRSKASEPRHARGNLVALFTAEDYPVDALRNNEQGTVGTRLQVDRTGRVSDCTVVQSSGSASLDKATCDILQKRAHFTPARNSDGQPIPDTYDQRVTWGLQ
jgi:protein TonB